MAGKSLSSFLCSRVSDQERLASLHAYQILDTPPESQFDAVARLAAKIWEAPIAAIILIDHRRQWVKAGYGIDLQELPLEYMPTAYTVATGNEVVVGDVGSDSRFADHVLQLSGESIRFYAGSPLVDHEGYCLGVLCVMDHGPRQVEPEQIKLLSALARSTMGELVSRRRGDHAETNRRAQHAGLSTVGEPAVAGDLYGAIPAGQNVDMTRTDYEGNSEQHLQFITDALPTLVSYVDAGQRFRFNNKAYEEWFGYSRAELYGKHLREVIGSHYDKRKPYIERALDGERVSYETTICDIQGTRHDVYIDYIPDIDTSGVVNGFVTQIWDMTARKQVEGSLHDLKRDYRALIDSIEGIVWEADTESLQFTFVSAEAERMLGYPVERWLEEQNFWENHIHPDDRQETIDSCLRSIARVEDNDLEYRMMASDGRIVWLRDIVSVKMEDGIRRLRGVMIDITRQKEAEQKLDYLANFDALTDLPNRSLFIDRLERALAYSIWHKRPLAVLAISIRRMKRINESLGREAGDSLLVEFANRLQSLLRSRDTTARLSGNEFAVLLADMSRKTDVGRILEKLVNGLSMPFHIVGHDVNPTVNIGISMPLGDDDDAIALLNNAETAMHQLDNPVGVSYQHYSRSLGQQISGVLTIENALRRALEEDEFKLCYQPQVDMATGKIVSVEALLRWSRADTGTVIQPSEFIALAEESGLIMPIGSWVLQRACRDFKAWCSQGHDLPSIAINISARQFQGTDLVREIEQVIANCQLHPGNLELELTESVLQDQTTSQQMHDLAALGVRLAIDDFGTGYSSLSYLKHLPVHKLKIDRSFMHGVPQVNDNTAIIEAIIAMGHSMKLQVVAEGVETVEQSEHLQNHGCNIGQGYLFSRPVSLERLLQLVGQQPD